MPTTHSKHKTKRFSFLRDSLLAVTPAFLEISLSDSDAHSFQGLIQHTFTENTEIVPTEDYSGLHGFTLSSHAQLEETSKPDTSCKQVSKQKNDPLDHLPSEVNIDYVQFPFFTNKRTYHYIKNSKDVRILFIMRGLSGSGKSTLVKLINTAFSSGSGSVVVCSADDFFYDENGEYRFDEKLLSAAHSSCQHKAKEACQELTRVVVIDNTNVRQWEMKPYFHVALAHGYITVLVEPKTPWRMNAEVLAQRNSHGVPVELIQRKVKSFENVVPSYYGWFCTQEKSESLLNLCRRLLRECLSSFPQFKDYLLSSLGTKPGTVDEETSWGILEKYYIRKARSGALLHCTAKFCARGKIAGSLNYHNRADVKDSCGKMFPIQVPGLVFTIKTLGARVNLGSEGKSLFCKPEEVGWCSSKAKTSQKFDSGERNPRKAGAAAGNAETYETHTKSKKTLSKKAAAKVDKRMKKQAKKNAKCESVDERDGCEEGEVTFGEEHGLKDNASRWSEDYGASSLDANLFGITHNASVSDESFLNENDSEPRVRRIGEKAETSNDENDSAPRVKSAGVELFGSANKHNSVLNGDFTISRVEPKGIVGQVESTTGVLEKQFPMLNYGGQARSAHFTLGTAQGVESKEVNFDLLTTCDIEEDAVRNDAMPRFVNISHGQACYYGNGICCVYFYKPFTLKTIFSGFY